jgi:hypothetical protein
VRVWLVFDLFPGLFYGFLYVYAVSHSGFGYTSYRCLRQEKRLNSYLETSGGVKIEIKRTRRGKTGPDALKKAVEENLTRISANFPGYSTARRPPFTGGWQALVSPIKKDLHLPGKIRRGGAEFREKLAMVPEETRACIDESGINKPLVRECGRGEDRRRYCRPALLFREHDKRLIRGVVQDEVCQSSTQRHGRHNGKHGQI